MKVLQVSGDLGASSGVGTFVRRIVGELKNLGVEGTVASSIVDLENACAESRPDIVHIHGIWLGLHHAAAHWARARGIPVVWSTHGMTAPWALRHKRWKKLPAWLLFQKRDLKRAAALHCTTELEADWNRALGLPPSFVVPLGTDLPEAGALDAHRGPVRPLPSEAGADAQESLRVLFVGRIYPVKGLANLLQAAALLKRTSPRGFSFRLVGPDEAGHRAELEAICRREALENVVFTGAKHGVGLEREYETCDVLVLPSFTENFGGVVVDALAHGKPVIASRFTPWKVLEAKGCGWWVDNSPESLAATLEQVARMTPAERAAWGVRGRALVETSYTWPSVGRALLAQYAQIVRRA